VFPQLVERYIEQQLVTKAAAAANIADRPGVKQRIALVTRGVINQAYIEERIKAQVTDDRLHAEYRKAIAQLPKREQVHARHILVHSEKEAEALIAELKAGGDFAVIAAKKSIDPAARSGGDLGFFTQEQMVPEFSAAAFKLKPGEFTATPVKTQYGWHVIKVEERRIAPPPKFSDMANELKRRLSENAFKDIVDALRAKAKVVIVGASPATPGK
jgi:peptidyl-prolyl cis-trans isomerase C